MAEYTHHPEPSCEIREGFTADDYCARARGFSSTAEFREYRDASESRRAEMRADRDSRTDDNRDLVRVLEVLKVM